VVRIRLTIGAMRDIVQEWMQRYFDHVSVGTIAEGAQIVIERCPTTVKCVPCGHVYPADLLAAKTLCCPRCGDARATLETGRELRIDGIEVQ
jgi:hydrogenase nickel incorporation protein HypA/HybF